MLYDQRSTHQVADRIVSPDVAPAPLSLLSSDWTQVLAAGWTLSAPSVGVLRLAWDGSGTVDWAGATRTGLGLIWPQPLTSSYNGERSLCEIRIRHTFPTANGIGVGVGFCVQSAGPVSDFGVRICERDAAATVRWDLNSDAQANLVAAGQAHVGGIRFAAVANGGGVSTIAHSAYTSSLSVSSRAVVTSAAYQNFVGVAMYPFLVGVGGLVAGSVDIERCEIVNLRHVGW